MINKAKQEGASNHMKVNIRSKLKILVLLSVILTLFLTGCAGEYRSQDNPYTDKDLASFQKKAEKYMNSKYPGHEFTITVGSELRGGNGVPARYFLNFNGKDENNTEFKIYYGYSSDDSLIHQLFGRPRFYKDTYST